MDLVELRQIAEQVAVAAGALLVDGRGAEPLATDAKSSPTDVVTEMDRAAEQLITTGLLQLRPDDGLIGEEGTRRAGTTGVDWLVDPLDGTVNYLYGLGGWAVSVAALVGGESVAGVVHVPNVGETFAAVRGGGATCNGHPLRLGPGPSLDQALVATGFGYAAARRANQAAVLQSVLPAVRDIRRFGACAVDLCLVATGRVDAYFERGVQPWDHAAGSLIATEAGALFAGLCGRPPSDRFVLAAPPAVFGPLHDLLVAAGADAEVD
ncbi:MAG TPA: inositol monophosphatase family protein [Sporichthyaceae bacterium]|jgi:myo-inositol-1(or 4)-monophosphatase|nr:inositol monophosphatase family protein [Sporichthyaceae bacterium]